MARTHLYKNETNIKRFWSTIFDYKFSIIAITFFSLALSAAYLHFIPNTYRASTIIELSDGGGNPAIDKIPFVGLALQGSSSIANQSTLFKTRFLARRAYKYLNNNIRYFMPSQMRQIELYGNAPFSIETIHIDQSIYGKTFEITLLNENSFKLQLRESSSALDKLFGLFFNNEKKIDSVFSGEYDFNNVIKSEFFELIVQKEESTLKNNSYSFKIYNLEGIYNHMAEHTEVDLAKRGSSIIEVEYFDTVALRAKRTANALSKAFIDQEIEQKTEVANKTLSFIDKELDGIHEALQSSENSLEDFKEKNIILNIDTKAQLASNKLSQYETKLSELQLQEDSLLNLKRFLSNNDDMAGAVMGSAAFVDSSLGFMISELQDRLTRRESLLVEFTELHPDVIKINQEISSIKNSIRQSVNSSLVNISERKGSIKRVINEQKEFLEELPEQERKLMELTRKFVVNDKIYSYLLEKRAEAAIARSSTVSKTQILDFAEEPEIPVEPKRKLIYGVVFFMSLLTGIIYALFRDYIQSRIKDYYDIEQLTQLPVFGTIPRVKSSKKLKKRFPEAFRALRTNIHSIPSRDRRCMIIAITSSVQGEGKTVISCNLGNIISKSEKRVVIIDADMRRPKVHDFFKLKNKQGLSSYLSGEKTYEEVVQKIDNFLNIVPAGPLPINPSELLMTNKMTELIMLLKNSYDYVIIDTPPFGLVTDGVLVMKSADLSLVATRVNYTKKEFVKNFDRQVKEKNIKYAGIILNDVPIGRGSMYDGYGKGYLRTD